MLLSTKELSAIIIDAIEDVKGKEIVCLDTTHKTKLFEQIIICSGTSSTQLRSLANRVCQKVKLNGGDIQTIEGLDGGEWVLVDCMDVVVHIMLPPIRAYYNLEAIWDISTNHK
jgi:ribosome-associated protein